MTGITPASAGRVHFGDTDISTLGADRICQLGMARTFQLNAAFDSLTVRENIEIAAYFAASGAGWLASASARMSGRQQ